MPKAKPKPTPNKKPKATPTETLKEVKEELEGLRILLAQTQAAYLEFQNNADKAYAQMMEYWHELPEYLRKINEAVQDSDVGRTFVYLGTLESFQRGVVDYMNLSEHGSQLFCKEKQHTPQELFA